MNTPHIDELKKYFKDNIRYDLSPFEVFNRGVQFMIEYNKERKDIMKVYNHLGYDIDTREILRILQHKDNEFFDKARFIDNIVFTDVIINMTSNIVIFFEADSDYGTHKDLEIQIDTKGNVIVDLSDTPWEGGGAEEEMETAIMKYTTNQKFNHE